MRFKKKSRPNALKSLENRADRIFSDYIRLRDTDDFGVGRCCTCNNPYQILWNQEKNCIVGHGVDCGHYQERNKKSTRFEEKNSSGQCRYCNYYRKGQKELHRDYLDKKYGIEEREKIDIKSRNITHDYRFTLLWAIEHYQQKFDQLLVTKHLSLAH